jgi:hypothetical protein
VCNARPDFACILSKLLVLEPLLLACHSPWLRRRRARAAAAARARRRVSRPAGAAWAANPSTCNPSRNRRTIFAAEQKMSGEPCSPSSSHPSSSGAESWSDGEHDPAAPLAAAAAAAAGGRRGPQHQAAAAAPRSKVVRATEQERSAVRWVTWQDLKFLRLRSGFSRLAIQNSAGAFEPATFVSLEDYSGETRRLYEGQMNVEYDGYMGVYKQPFEKHKRYAIKLMRNKRGANTWNDTCMQCGKKGLLFVCTGGAQGCPSAICKICGATEVPSDEWEPWTCPRCRIELQEQPQHQPLQQQPQQPRKRPRKLLLRLRSERDIASRRDKTTAAVSASTDSLGFKVKELVMSSLTCEEVMQLATQMLNVEQLEKLYLAKSKGCGQVVKGGE